MGSMTISSRSKDPSSLECLLPVVNRVLYWFHYSNYFYYCLPFWLFRVDKEVEQAEEKRERGSDKRGPDDPQTKKRESGSDDSSPRDKKKKSRESNEIDRSPRESRKHHKKDSLERADSARSTGSAEDK